MLESLEDRLLLSSSASLVAYPATAQDGAAGPTPGGSAVTSEQYSQKPELAPSSGSDKLFIESHDGYAEATVDQAEAAHARLPLLSRLQGDELSEYSKPSVPLPVSLPPGLVALLDGPAPSGQHAGAEPFRGLLEERARESRAEIAGLIAANGLAGAPVTASQPVGGPVLKEGSQTAPFFLSQDLSGGPTLLAFMQPVASTGLHQSWRGEESIGPVGDVQTKGGEGPSEQETDATMEQSPPQEETLDLRPETGIPLAGVLPLDLRQLQQNVDAFFTHLAELAQDTDSRELVLRLAPWLAVTTVAAWSITYLPRRRATSATGPELPVPDSFPLPLDEDE
jgi:hypothetical protein